MGQSSSSAITSPETGNREFSFGGLRLQSDGILLRGDEIIHLPPKELAALRLLLTHAGQIVTHQQLKHALWGDVHVTDDSIPKCISSLRELLTPDDCIQTVYKRGYRLSLEVHRPEQETPEGLPRLAILPFAVDMNLPPYVGSAVAEETISLLTAGHLSPAHVLARDSAFSLASRGLTAHQVGEALQADLVLTGTLRSLPAHIRLRAEMIRVSDGTQIWVEDMLVPQERAAGVELELANRLSVRLSTGSLYASVVTGRNPQPAQNSSRREAYELYLRGHHEWQTLQRHRMQEGVQHLIRAIELDPTLYAAQVDLANASVAQAFSGFISPAEESLLVRQCAEAIPTTDEGAESVLPALAWVRFHVDHDLPGALRALSAGVHLPHETATTRIRSVIALSRQRFNDAIEMITEALHVDPYSPWLNARLAWAYHLAGENDRSVTQAEHALDLFPDHDSSCVYGASILAFNGKRERAISVAENLVRRSPYFDLATAVYGYTLAKSGRDDEARNILERLQWLSRERFVLSSFTAAVCMALDDPDGAIAELHAAAEARCPWFFTTLADPRLEPLRSRSEFAKMSRTLERMESAAEKRAGQDS